MRLLALYLQARRVPAALVAVLLSTAVLWLASVPIDDVASRLALGVLAAAAGTAAIGPGLVGADPDLERTAALAWPPRRAAHVTAGTAAVCGILVVTGFTGEPFVHSGVLIRDAVGLGGLVALGAATVGTGWAWLPGLMWTMVGLMTGPVTGAWYKELLTWTAQPVGTRSATVMAVLLAVGGGLAYSILGGRGRGQA